MLDLGQDGEALVGRKPNPETLKSALGSSRPTPRVLTIPTPSVSANHVLIRVENGTLVVRDLGSRNGTWLLLPRSQDVRVGKVDTVLQLARSGAEAPANDEPPTPEWEGRQGFAPAVASSIERWPRLRGLDVEVRVLSERSEPQATDIPLASGESLGVLPRATTDANWSQLLEKLWGWVARQNSLFEAEERTRSEGMILASPAIRAAHREVVAAGQNRAKTLLLMGPCGAGKEMLAEVFHRHSGQSGPFVAVNCALFSKDLVRSELFGAEAGSFTGATRRILGAVERAQGGTLFLDEIGELPLDVQPMLLRFLDRREFEPLGSYGKPQTADVRVVFATNQDLRRAARDGRFRVDLWYRLSVHVVEVPELRTRWEDIVAYLADTHDDGAQHCPATAFSDEALEVLRSHTWDGNFRELANFRRRFPRDAKPRSIDAKACRRALAEGSLRTPSDSGPDSPPREETGDDWGVLVARAVRAFTEDHGHLPQTWDDQKEWNEKYLKPLLFHRIAGLVAEGAPPDDGALSALASRTAAHAGADRGTARKQLARYYQRFGG